MERVPRYIKRKKSQVEDSMHVVYINIHIHIRICKYMSMFVCVWYTCGASIEVIPKSGNSGCLW